LAKILGIWWSAFITIIENIIVILNSFNLIGQRLSKTQILQSLDWQIFLVWNLLELLSLRVPNLPAHYKVTHLMKKSLLIGWK